MRLRLLRHATLELHYAGRKLLLDPMLADAGAMPPIENSPNPRPNPLVPLPSPASELLDGVEAILVTHTHRDHWDAAATAMVPKHAVILGQAPDGPRFQEWGFRAFQAVDPEVRWQGVTITRTGGEHGRGRTAQAMAPVSGFVLRAPGEPTIYIAGDTIWCAEVERAIEAHQPDVTVVNAGGARFLDSEPITMDAADVIRTAQARPAMQVFAVHMEAINHCLLTRADLQFQVETARLEDRVRIPLDGEWI